MVEYVTPNSGDRIAVEGSSPIEIGVSWETDRFILDSLFVEPFGEDRDMVNISVKRSFGDVPDGNMGVVVGGRECRLFHMDVREGSRRSGVGSFLFDVFIGICLWDGGESISGRIGGGKGTKSFFVDSGIPEGDLEIITNQNGGESVKIDTEMSRVDFDRDRYVIKRR